MPHHDFAVIRFDRSTKAMGRFTKLRRAGAVEEIDNDVRSSSSSKGSGWMTANNDHFSVGAAEAAVSSPTIDRAPSPSGKTRHAQMPVRDGIAEDALSSKPIAAQSDTRPEHHRNCRDDDRDDASS